MFIFNLSQKQKVDFTSDFIKNNFFVSFNCTKSNSIKCILNIFVLVNCINRFSLSG